MTAYSWQPYLASGKYARLRGSTRDQPPAGFRFVPAADDSPHASQHNQIRTWLVCLAILAASLRLGQIGVQYYVESRPFPYNSHPQPLRVVYDGSFMRSVMP